jgi:hypothetical protein
VADLHGGHPCTTPADCEGLSLPEGAFFYCAGINGAAAKTCWTRPASDPCTRNPSREPGTYTTPATAALLDGNTTTWMTYACMANEDLPMGCATGDSVSATSPTLEATPR